MWGLALWKSTKKNADRRARDTGHHLSWKGGGQVLLSEKKNKKRTVLTLAKIQARQDGEELLRGNTLTFTERKKSPKRFKGTRILVSQRTY